MNDCCKKEISALVNHIADTTVVLIKLSGKRQSVMEEATYRRAEIMTDVLEQIKEFVSKR